jgi:hypothetical protein
MFENDLQYYNCLCADGLFHANLPLQVEKELLSEVTERYFALVDHVSLKKNLCFLKYYGLFITVLNTVYYCDLESCHH